MRDYQTKANDPDVADSIVVEKLGAHETNSALKELKNGVSKTGQTLTDQSDSGDDEVFTQLATAMFINAMSAQTFQDSGIASAYIITPLTGSGGLVAPTDYSQMNGAVVSFIPSNANPAGASTLDFGQTAGSLLGTKAILSLAAAPLAANVLDTTHYHEFRFSVFLNAWLFIGKKRAADPVTGLFDAYGKWSDKKTSSNAGGTFTKDAWRKRDLGFEDSDGSNLGVLANDQLTLEAGTYVCAAQAPGHKVNKHILRLRDTTGATTLLQGANADCSATANVTTLATLSGKFTIGIQSVLEIQHYSTTTQATTGFGNPMSIGVDEIYTIIELWRVL
jgi:hypothetical protein